MKTVTDFIKKYWLVVLLVLVAGVFLFQRCKINKLKDENQLQSVTLSTLNDSVSVFKAKSGDLTFKLSSVQIESDNLRNALEVAGYSVKDLKEKEVKWRNIVSVLKAQLETAGHGQTVLRDTTWVYATDTIHAARLLWSNHYLSLDGNIVNKQLDFRYGYKTSLDIVQTKQGKGTLVNIYLSDPNATITSGNSFVVTPVQRWYMKPWVWGLVGLGGGIFISK